MLPMFPFTKEQCDQLLERWTMAYALSLGEYLLFYVNEKVDLSMGLTSYRFLDQLPVLHVIGRRKAEIRALVLKKYGGMNDLSWSVFQRICADLGVSRPLSYGQIRDLFLAFLMQGAENLPELQAYLAWYDGERPNDPSTDGGNDERLPQVPLDEVPRLLACIGVLPNMEEPDDRDIAKGVDQFYTRGEERIVHFQNWHWTP